jgi:hypothetical protein
MARQPIKTISTNPVKFIPSNQKLDPSLTEEAANIADRPLVFFVKKITRDGHFKIRELLEFKDETNHKRGLTGSGDVAKYIWENYVVEVRNVVINEGDEVKTYESLVGEEKNKLWNTEGMDAEMTEAILFARSESYLSETEAKN